VRRRRNPVARFLVYWAIISLGPILLGIGLVSTSYLLSTSVVSDVDVSLGFELKNKLLSSVPFLTTSVAFTLIYTLVPNCFVSRKNAFIGGVIAAVLFELAKYGFGIYVKSVPSFEVIYGAIAIIPTFLIWMYMSWVIVILGAHITFCLSAFRMEFEKKATQGSDWTFVDAYKLVCGLWRSQKKGVALTSTRMKQYGIKLPQFQVNEIMELLLAANWVQRGAGGAWMLCRDLAEVTLLDLYRIIPRRLPMRDTAQTGDSWTDHFHQFLSKQNEDMEALLSLPLRDLLMQAEQSDNNT
jgi:membrane protein